MHRWWGRDVAATPKQTAIREDARAMLACVVAGVVALCCAVRCADGELRLTCHGLVVGMEQ